MNLKKPFFYPYGEPISSENFMNQSFFSRNFTKGKSEKISKKGKKEKCHFPREKNREPIRLRSLMMSSSLNLIHRTRKSTVWEKEVTTEFEAILREFETNPKVNSAVLISAKQGCFVTGADISMLEKCQFVEEGRKISHEGQILFNCMEKSPKPIVCAINGVCLGGGFALALACHYRISTTDKRTGLGLPEGEETCDLSSIT